MTRRTSEQGFFHVLNQGEDIWFLAELYYGDASLWWVIYHANPQEFGDDPERCEVGLSVFIPYVETGELDTQAAEFSVQSGAHPSCGPMVLLARERYGDDTLCFALYERNGWEPDRVLVPGEPLTCPARADTPAMRKAKNYRSIFYRR